MALSVASVKLTLNKARASRSPSIAATARSRSRPASWPITTPTTRRRRRLSHSAGSLTVNVYSGWMNRKS